MEYRREVLKFEDTLKELKKGYDYSDKDFNLTFKEYCELYYMREQVKQLKDIRVILTK